MVNILLLVPMYGNGGIASWTKKFIKTFPNEEYNLIPVSSVLAAKNISASTFTRIITGLKELFIIKKNILEAINNNKIDIFHTTTSGSLGSFRDYFIGRLCKKRGIRTIMHCRYGCMPEVLRGKGIIKKILLLSLKQYNQIWVLDKYTYDALENLPITKGKVFLTPNSIKVDELQEIPPKFYNKIAFIANIVSTKGIFELVDAFKSIKQENISLHIVGPSDNKTLSVLNSKISDDERITYYGKLPNEKAVEFLKGIDILALPTYYSGEAFPISILEAMSYGKMVISTPRAAIKDMLTATDGSECGYLVREKSVEEIAKAIKWCQANPQMADERCKKAYDKVYNCYRTDVIYELYRSLYKKALLE